MDFRFKIMFLRDLFIYLKLDNDKINLFLSGIPGRQSSPMPTKSNKDRLIALFFSFRVGLKALRIFSSILHRTMLLFCNIFSIIYKFRAVLSWLWRKWISKDLQTTKRNMPVAWRGLEYRPTVSFTVWSL